MTTIIDIPLGEIKPSKTNPRKTFRKIEELSASILEAGPDGKPRGVLQPITVRPNPHDDVKKWPYELVFGERRWRASKHAGMPTIPAIVKDIGEEEVLRRQLIENVQREDVHPMEEAEAFELLMKNSHQKADELAAEIGKSRAHVYGRLKLLRLAPGPRKAFLDDRIGAAVAELIARLPDVKLQELATKEILGEEVKDEEVPCGEAPGVENEVVSGEGKDNAFRPSPLSFRATQALLHRRYSLRLELAKFDVHDVDLLPLVVGKNGEQLGGGCGPCPHRSGNTPDLFPDLTRPADVCTLPACFEAKTKAAWDKHAAKAKADKIKVIEGKAAKDVFDYAGRVAYNSTLVDPDAELPYDLRIGNQAKAPTWAKLLGKAHQIPTTLVQDPSGAPRMLIDKAAAVAALREAGKIDKPTKPSGSTSPDVDYKKERAKEKAKGDLKEAAFTRVLGMVAEDLDGFEVASDTKTNAGKKTVATLRWIATRLLSDAQEIDYAAVEGIVVRRGLGANDAGDAIEGAIEKARTAGEVLSLIVELQLAVIGDAIARGGGAGGEAAAFKTACELFDADWAKAQELAKAAAKAEAAVDAKKPKAKKGGAK